MPSFAVVTVLRDESKRKRESVVVNGWNPGTKQPHGGRIAESWVQ